MAGPPFARVRDLPVEMSPPVAGSFLAVCPDTGDDQKLDVAAFLAQGQTGAVLAGLSVQGDIDLSGANNRRLLFHDPSGMPDHRTLSQRISTFGTGRAIYIEPRLDGDAALPTICRLVIGGNGTDYELELRNENAGGVRMDRSSKVTVPVAADGDTNTAAQTTAFDPATGRVAVNGAEIGDTGWRDVSADLQNGWAGAFHIRRVASTVEILFAASDPVAATSDVLYTLLTGWRPRRVGTGASTSRVNGLNAASGSAFPSTSRGWRTNGSTNNQIGADQSGVHNGRHSFGTIDPWPDTLPGVPSST